MSVERVMRETSSTQYIQWLEYLRTEPNDFHRDDEYFNRILCALQHLLYKGTGRACNSQPSDFQLRFRSELERERPVSKVSYSKSVWCSYAGVSSDAGSGSSGDVGRDKFLDELLG
jgi:hypothetical protein